MRHTRPKQYFAAAHRAVAYGGAIEWKELPSLFASISKRLATGGRWPVSGAPPNADDSGFAPWAQSTLAFDDTVPAALDAYPVTHGPAGHRIATDS